MRSAADVQAVFDLLEQGLSHAEISRRTGVSRAAIRDWRLRGRAAVEQRSSIDHSTCVAAATRHPAAYAYLLGQYLGDGCISPMARGVHRLRVTCCHAYPELMSECALAMRIVCPNKVGSLPRQGCNELYSDWKHWPCAFPQAGPGPKHLRSIRLASWQEDIAGEHPGRLLRGLIHSDGCRCTNRVKAMVGGQPKVYEYPRYMFSNRSLDIQRIFTDACDRLGVRWRPDGPWQISIARQESIAILDEHVGAKT
jgi:hypothetical protein